jgi:hypothetical protein
MRNDYEMDRYNPKSEGLNGQDESNPIIVERSEKALPATQELIYNNGNLTLYFFNIKTSVHLLLTILMLMVIFLFYASLNFLKW